MRQTILLILWHVSGVKCPFLFFGYNTTRTSSSARLYTCGVRNATPVSYFVAVCCSLPGSRLPSIFLYNINFVIEYRDPLCFTLFYCAY